MAQEVCLVTGGRGFVGRHLVTQLLQRTQVVVRILDLASEINLSESERSGLLGRALDEERVQYVSVDLRIREQVMEACKGVAVVFHMAAPDTSINKLKLHYDVTVKGTQNVVDGCLAHGVRKLIYTSSPSIVFDGKTPIMNADESIPIADKHNDYYSEAKAQAEAIVLASNGKQGLLTCAIRPSGIFGPGDKVTIPALVTARKSGKLKCIIGDGKNLFDWTYVENVSHAHICAEHALIPGQFEGDNVAAGKAYFITNGETRRFWDLFAAVLEGLGYVSPTICVPVVLLMPLAYTVEWIFKQLAPLGVQPTNFTPSRLRIMTTVRTFNISRARKLIGYEPIVSFEEGVRRTVESFPNLRADVHPPKSRALMEPSKIRSLLGGGKGADLLLWSNTRETLTVLSALSFVSYVCFASGYTFLSLFANVASLVLIISFLYSHLPESVFGMDLPRIPPVSVFQISEESTVATALSLRSSWNSAAKVLKTFQEGEDWPLFFRVVLVLQFLKFLGGFSLQTLITLGLLMAFTIPYLYDQHEEECDQIVASCWQLLGYFKNLAWSKIPKGLKKYLHH